MARITAKQAKEMNEAYAKVYQNLQEKERPQSKFMQTYLRNKAGQDDLNNKTKDLKLTGSTSDASLRIKKDDGNNNTSNKTQVKTQNTQTTEKPATSSGGGTTQKSERPVSSAKQRWLDSQQSQKNLKDATKGYKFSRTDDGNIRADKVSGNNNNQSSSSPNGSGGSRKVDGKALMNKLKADSGDRVQSGGQQPTQEPGVKTSQTVVKDGNKTTTTTRRSADSSTPEGAAAVNKEKAAFADRMASRRAARDGNAGGGGQPPSTQGGDQQKTVRGQGNRERPVKTGGIQVGKSIKGGLSRLGSLAGKAVAGARNVASNVKQGAQAVAGGIKQGAQAVAGALANKGPIQGRASGPQRRAQQAQNRTGRPVPAANAANAAPAAKPVATRPVQGQQPAAKPVLSNNSPAAKAGIPLNMRQAAADKNAAFQAARKSGNLKQYRKDNPQLSGADRAKAMAKERIAAKKSAPAPVAQKRPGKGGITQSWQWDSYDPMFDDTVQFLVSEGHAKDKSEAVSIMSESEFIDAFNQELNG